MSLTPEEAVAAVLAALALPGPVVVAVSGGGDSTALLHATAAVAQRPVLAVTVDHGLRPEAAAEAEGVALACRALGIPHETLRWEGAGRGNLQEQARDARRQLIGGWACGRGAVAVLLGHTADDQAETVLLRLARGSGVDGLAGMPAGFVALGVAWHRPFLGIGRESLRDWLRARDIGWVDDPSNEDRRFDRVRARDIMARLGELGLSRDRLVRTAGHMARARASLADHARQVATREVREDGRDLLLPLGLVSGIEGDDAAARILAAALQWVGGGDRRPRWESLRRLATMVAAGRGATLGGCRVKPEKGWARVSFEGRHAQGSGRDPRQRFAQNADFR